MQYFKIEEGLVEVEDIHEADFILSKGLTRHDRRAFLNEYNLPGDIFQLDEITPIAPRMELIDRHTDDDIIDSTIVLLANVFGAGSDNNVEDRLETLTFVLVYDQLFLFIDEESTIGDKVIDRYGSRVKNVESIILYTSLIASNKFSRELESQKEIIDFLQSESKSNTSPRILEELADTERNLVFLEHTLDTQSEVLSNLLSNERFMEKVNNRSLAYDVKWYNRQVNKLVHLYQDLVQTVGGMIADLMSGQLNKIAKVLNSLSIILAVGSLIVGYFGINTGGLPWLNQETGSWYVIIIIALASLVTSIVLKYMDR